MVNSEFLSIYLNSELANVFFSRYVSVATIAYLNSENLKSIVVPLPPLPIQQSIAEEVMSRRARAKVLQVEAREILEQAKKAFEIEILG